MCTTREFCRDGGGAGRGGGRGGGGKNYTLRCIQNTSDHLTAVQGKEITA